MPRAHEPIAILLADDDEDDQQFVREAMAEGRLANRLVCVSDGEELLAYLRDARAGGESDGCRPGLVLLDLNMPRMDGREALRRLKSDPDLRRIPVVVLTTSKAEEDIVRSYDLGANSFVTKPVTFEGLVGVMKSLGRYWFEIVDLPPSDAGAS